MAVIMSEENQNVKIRRAPSGKVYIVCDGEPICDTRGLRYFDDERDAIDFLERFDLAAIVARAVMRF
jgi:hypothetical protein